METELLLPLSFLLLEHPKSKAVPRLSGGGGHNSIEGEIEYRRTQGVF